MGLVSWANAGTKHCKSAGVMRLSENERSKLISLSSFEMLFRLEKEILKSSGEM